MDYTKIKTWAVACKVHGYDPKALPEVKHLPKQFREWIINTYMMGVIVEAVNTDEKGKVWLPDYNNHNQYKYEAFFGIKATKAKPSGVGFSGSGYGHWNAGSRVGSRLCFESREKLQHVQKHFEKVFKKMYIIEK